MTRDDPQAASRRRESRWILPLGLLTGLVLMLIYLPPVQAKLSALGYPADNFWLRYLAATLLGGVVGFSEVVLRYRDEPARASTSMPGLVFILLNGTVAAFALFLVEYFSTPTERGDAVQRVLLTGIGAMVVLRGKLLTVPMPGGTRAELGFAPLVESILASVNREIDRERAQTRLQLVAARSRDMAVLGFDRVAPYLRTGLQALQTLDADVQRGVLEAIKAAEADTSSTDGVLMEAIGYELLNNFGEECFLELFRQAELSARREVEFGPWPSP